MDNTSKLFWFLMALCYCITAPACRVMKKSLDVENTHSQLSESIAQKTAFKVIDSSRKDSKELITYEFTFRDFEAIPETDRTISAPSPEEITSFISTMAVDRLLDRVASLKVEVSREHTEQKAVRTQGTEEKRTDRKETTEKKTKAIDKEADSTIGANLPWYSWLIGAALIFGIVWYLVKKVKPF